jgi:lysophospholipase L1-like esterase
MMVRAHAYILSVLFLALGFPSPTIAGQILACGQFTKAPIALPRARTEAQWLERFELIATQERAQRTRILFLGDSITERWPVGIWERNFSPLGGLNAGIDGDRTEHLLWRIENGNTGFNPPDIIVLLIGTNDLGHGRKADLTAEGVRADLRALRQRLPATRILLLGLTPRSDRFGHLAQEVNGLLKSCNGGLVTYAEIGGELRDRYGGVERGMLLDGVHLSETGYAVLATALVKQLDKLLNTSTAPHQ